ncbi:MAG: hypothetical protein WC475_04820 [Candidatus Paceibacterota bacterium]
MAEDGKECCCDPDCMNTAACSSMTGSNQCPTSVDSQGCPDSIQKDCYRNQCLQTRGEPYEVTRDNCVFIECKPSDLTTIGGGQGCTCDDGIRTSCPSNGLDIGGPCCCDADCFNHEQCSQITTTSVTASGCTKMVDANGMIRIECPDQDLADMNCPSSEELQRMKTKCLDNNGNPQLGTDQRGCQFVDCRFNTATSGNASMFTNVVCPQATEIDAVIEKCKASGFEPKIYFDRGCKFVNCAQPSDIYCSEKQDQSVIDALNCPAQGLVLGKDYDDKGCPVYKCLQPGYCRTEIPDEALQKCKEFGGEMVTNADPQGCISFFKCVQRGQGEQSYIAPVTEVPEATKLMQVALGLETLNMKLDELARKTGAIADYYASTGSASDEARFRTVSGMFRGVIEKVNAIKLGIRDNLNSMTTEYLEEVKQDIKYIKDVVLMDIVYVMLSSGEDFESTNETTNLVCDTDECFDKYYRICQPTTFTTNEGFKVQILGVENYSCVMKVTLPEDKAPEGLTLTPPYEMTCTKASYALGFNPDEDISQYCEGNLVDIISETMGEKQ